MKTWPQFLLKFVISHPAITVVTPATSQPGHMLENLSAGVGALPDKAMRRRMIGFVEKLPELTGETKTFAQECLLVLRSWLPAAVFWPFAPVHRVAIVRRSHGVRRGWAHRSKDPLFCSRGGASADGCSATRLPTRMKNGSVTSWSPSFRVRDFKLSRAWCRPGAHGSPACGPT